MQHACRITAGKRIAALALVFALVFTGIAIMPNAAKADAAAGTVPIGSEPYSVVVNPVTNRVYIACKSSNYVVVMDGAKDDVIARLPISGQPECIAVNPATNRVYVASPAGNCVTIIDGETNSLTKLDMPAPVSIAVNPVTNKVYVANSGTDTVTVIGANNAILTTVMAETGLCCVAVNPATNRIYAANTASGTITVIDGATDQVLPAARIYAKANAMAVNPALNRIYATDRDTNQVSVINGTETVTMATRPMGTAPSVIAVNPVTGNVYVAAGGEVRVIDANNNITNIINVGAGANAMAVNSANNKIYTANSSGNSVTVIDGETGAATTIPVGPTPSSIAVNPLTGKVYVANSGSTCTFLTVIDGNSNVMASVTVDLCPSAVTVNPATGKVYFPSSLKNNVIVMDGKDNSTVLAPTGAGPWKAAVNPVTNRIYVINQNVDTVTVLNGADNTTLAEVAVGGYPSDIAVNPVTNMIYTANTNGNNVTVINGATNAVATVAVGSGPRAVAVNPATGKVYTANYTSNDVTVIDGDTNAAVTVAVGTHPCAIAVNPANNKIFIANEGSNNVTVINGETNATVTVPTDTQPCAVAVNPVTNSVYVANYGSGTMTVIDCNDEFVPYSDSVGAQPCAIAIDEALDRIYVLNSGNETVSVFDCAITRLGTLAAGSNPWAIAVDPVSHKVYISCNNSITAIDVQKKWTGCLSTAITALPHNATSDTTPTFEFTATSGYTPNTAAVSQIYYQVDRVTGPWLKASPAGGSAEATLSALSPGTHILYAFAADGMEATSINTYPASGIVPGSVTAYVFTVVDYKVSVAANNAAYGTVTGGRTYSHGDEAVLHAAPKSGYRFVRWTENGTEVSANADYTITVLGPRTLTAEFEEGVPVTVTCRKTDVARYGASTGAITATAAGGNSGAYQYSKDGGATWQASGSFTNLAAGTYSVKARDANDTATVSAAVNVTIGQPKLAWTGAANKMPSKASAGKAWVVKASAKPAGYTLKSVKYASSNAGIAYIDAKGNTTFLKGGKVKITVTTVFKKGTKLKTVKIVKQVSVTQLVSSIKLNKTAAVIKAGKTLKLIPKIGPSSATNKKVKWKSSNTKVATVTASGVVKAKKKGTVVITCAAMDGSKVTVTCKITVN